MKKCFICKKQVDADICKECRKEFIRGYAERIVNTYVPEIIQGSVRDEQINYVHEELTSLVNNLTGLRRES